MLTRANIQARLVNHFPSEQERALTASFDAIRVDLDALVAWGTTLATKLNNDAGVADVNYAAPVIVTTGI